MCKLVLNCRAINLQIRTARKRCVSTRLYTFRHRQTATHCVTFSQSTTILCVYKSLPRIHKTIYSEHICTQFGTAVPQMVSLNFRRWVNSVNVHCTQSYIHDIFCIIYEQYRLWCVYGVYLP